MSSSTTSLTINSIQFAEFLDGFCKKLGFRAGTKNHHWQFMRFIRRHKDTVFRRVGELVSIVKFRKRNHTKFSGVAVLSEEQIVEYLKLHKATKNIVDEIVLKLKEMAAGFAPLNAKLKLVENSLVVEPVTQPVVEPVSEPVTQPVTQSVTQSVVELEPQKSEVEKPMGFKPVPHKKLRFKYDDGTSGVVVDPKKFAQVRKNCLVIPKAKDRHQLIFERLKDEQLINGCVAMTTYRVKYTVILTDEEEEKISREDYQQLMWEGVDVDDFSDDEDGFVVRHTFVEERKEMQMNAGCIVKIVGVDKDDTNLFRCRMFLPGSESVIVLIHYSALIALDIEMRREVITIIRDNGAWEACDLSDVKTTPKAQKPPKAPKRSPYPAAIFA
jgi:hypothetical protein